MYMPMGVWSTKSTTWCRIGPQISTCESSRKETPRRFRRVAFCQCMWFDIATLCSTHIFSIAISFLVYVVVPRCVRYCVSLSDLSGAACRLQHAVSLPSCYPSRHSRSSCFMARHLHWCPCRRPTLSTLIQVSIRVRTELQYRQAAAMASTYKSTPAT